MRPSSQRLIFGLLITLAPVAHASLVATYTFNNNLAAQQSGVAALTAVNPENTSQFTTANVFGDDRTVYNFNGVASPPADQGGLDFTTTGLISDDVYSAEIVFSLTGSSGWRRLLDSLDRQSDDGLYIDPSNNLDLYPTGAGTSTNFQANTFYDLIVTVDASNNVVGYINGTQQFALTSTNLDVATNTLGLFLDNTAAGGQGEWSSGDIALFKVFNTALTPAQVAAEAANPFAGGSSGTPEPAAWCLLLAGTAALGCRRFLRSAQ